MLTPAVVSKSLPTKPLSIGLKEFSSNLSWSLATFIQPLGSTGVYTVTLVFAVDKLDDGSELLVTLIVVPVVPEIVLNASLKPDALSLIKTLAPTFIACAAVVKVRVVPE